jgi:tight adherence protein C
MDGVYDNLMGVFGDRSAIMLALLVFLAATTMAFGVMATVHARGAVKRRAAGIAEHSGDSNETRALRASSLKAVQRLLDYTTKHYSASDKDKGEMKVLRRRLIQAGVFDAHAVGYFFVARTALAVGLGVAVFVLGPMIIPLQGSSFWLSVIVGGIAGYLAPSLYLDRRISARRSEHRIGFPDFMDLLVVCADSGLSMEAALDRVGRELGDSYPSLCTNLHMANLEIRAGRSMTEALEARRPPGARGGTLVRHPHPAVGRARLQHHRRAAGLQRRYAPQAALARRGEGLQPAGEARDSDDGVHLSGAVRRHPAAGGGAALYRTLLSHQARKRR